MSDVSQSLTRETDERKLRRGGPTAHSDEARNGDETGAVNSTGRTEDDVAIVQRLREARERVKTEVAKVVVGQDAIIDSLLIGLLCRGHILLFGVPGLGKTLMGRTLARTLDMDFRRIQFTPDLMPSDITGTDVLEEEEASGRYSVKFMRGPVFTNFLLADEINRTPPKTQAALLQAMQEREVSVGRETYSLDPPFFVVATQNPIEMEGTYPLPEAQLDRFMFNLRVRYPTIDEEVAIVKGTTSLHSAEAAPVLSQDDVIRLQDLVRGVPIADAVVRFAARLVAATRPGEGEALDGVHHYISYGASPRASQYLVLGGKARAVLAGRYHVDFADVRELAHAVLRHRLVLNFHARADNLDADALIDRLLDAVPDEEKK
jgi:MoxR-like ATPase